ncbi:MAG: class I SAM-dependent methyltransferase [Erysipelotrichia bacterium]|nr:class I SAM-dependent methyltransferase [Erysipelotrichia bacterium]
MYAQAATPMNDLKDNITVLRQPDYSGYARFYDYFELAGREESEELNVFLDDLFRINGVKSILDFACGTGAQSIGLAKLGYDVTAADLNRQMLNIAIQKAKNIELKFLESDMCTARHGTFDAAICIFNAIGHLDRENCQKFFVNALEHLNPGGIFVTDILNFCAMNGGAFKQYKYMSREALIDGMLVHHVRNCKLDKSNRRISVKSQTRWQNGVGKPGEIQDNWQMQLYDAEELQKMLSDAGFAEIVLFGPTGCEFDKLTSDSILAVCQKKANTKGKTSK